MLRPLHDMPVGTLGFEAIGEVDDDDWERTVEPALRATLADGRKLRILYLFGPVADDVDGDVIAAGSEFRARHLGAYERVAVVSDENWLRPALKTLSILLPGQAKAFPVRDLANAKAWLADDQLEDSR